MGLSSNEMLLDEPPEALLEERVAPRFSPLTHESFAQPAPAWLKRGHIPGVDGVRAFAVILVLLHHCRTTPGFPQSRLLNHLALAGHFGVDIFFIISGFLITTLLAREIESTGQLSLKRFFTRRSLRIIPEYVALLLAVAVCQRMGFFQLSISDWIGATTYTTNFFYHPGWEFRHAWSLSVEEHFYLLWPFVLVAGGMAAGWRFASSCVVFCWLARCVIACLVPMICSPSDAASYAGMAECWTFTRLDIISMGCLLAFVSRIHSWRTWLDHLTQPYLLLIYAAVIGVSLEFLSKNTQYQLCVAYTLHGVCMTLIVWGLIRSEGFVKYVMNHPVLRAIGAVSYSVYLWQQLFIHPFRSGWIHEFPQNLIFALIAGIASYYLIGYPLRRLKNSVAS